MRDRTRREPFPAAMQVGQTITRLAREQHGLIIYPRRSIYGLKGDHVLIAPPLIIDEEGIHELIRRFDRSLAEVREWLESEMVPWTDAMPDRTTERYQQVEDLPETALGKLDTQFEVSGANVTGDMDQEGLEVPLIHNNQEEAPEE